jgi:hypothetical protein
MNAIYIIIVRVKLVFWRPDLFFCNLYKSVFSYFFQENNIGLKIFIKLTFGFTPPNIFQTDPKLEAVHRSESQTFLDQLFWFFLKKNPNFLDFFKKMKKIFEFFFFEFFFFVKTQLKEQAVRII